jgi:hypothetical protein
LYPRAHARYARAHTQGSPTEVYLKTRTLCGGPIHQEDTNHATHQNVSPNIQHSCRVRHSHPCPTACSTGRGSGLHRYRVSGGRRPCARCGCSPTASRRLPCTRGRGPASRGVWRSPGLGWGILRPLLSALETSSPWLAPVVSIPSFAAALPCCADREGLFLLLQGFLSCIRGPSQ